MAGEDDGLAYGELHGDSQKKEGGGSSFFDKMSSGFKNLKSEFEGVVDGGKKEYHAQTQKLSEHRFDSFVSPKNGNDVKWYVDGCSYMYAVSRAIEQATESIWILDWWLTPELYLRRPPSKNEQYRIDRMLLAAAKRGVKVSIIVYKEVTQALTLSSSHTKHALEDLHPNIAVFRHPDHLPDRQTLTSNLISSFQNLKLGAAALAKMPGDSIKAMYGMSEDVILYWAHHEKLCLIDGQVAFMGGLDLCFGRWDTNHHPIADAHPGDLNAIVYPGQDYNNARIADFEDVTHWDHNKVDRKQYSRMGWSDISISLHGPCVQDLRRHFVGRWNYIFDEKYHTREDQRYYKLSLEGQVFDRPWIPEGLRPNIHHHSHNHFEGLREPVHEGAYDLRHRFGHYFAQEPGSIPCQLVRSCTKWSNGTPTEHSIQNAYIDIITKSQHFVYIENQFFITATDDQQKPVENMIGKAIVERVLRAAENGQKFKVIVLIPSVPGFAGDLKDDAALGTRAIMEFQYHSINRGHGHSIMEQIAKAGYDPAEYIRFYNLRNYDRINASGSMRAIEKESGIDYEEARMQRDNALGAGYGGEGENVRSGDTSHFEKYQEAANRSKANTKWDSVAQCYMLNGADIRDVPWDGQGDLSEIDSFVSEELYIHSKVLIADDRTVICGSANLNDRSQLGTHDSEIALVIEDSTPVDSSMNGQPWRASRFAASLRRQLFRKHLGLLPPQDMENPDANFEPVGVPNEYDWGSREDRLVEDPLSSEFESLWNECAHTNTEVFRQVFHPVPDDTVRTWEDYEKFYEYYFLKADDKADDKESGEKSSRYEWGHVVRENFPPGDEGLRQVKDLLSRIKGTLVEMPLHFLDKEDIAESGAKLNALTEPVYT